MGDKHQLDNLLDTFDPPRSRLVQCCLVFDDPCDGNFRIRKFNRSNEDQLPKKIVDESIMPQSPAKKQCTALYHVNVKRSRGTIVSHFKNQETVLGMLVGETRGEDFQVTQDKSRDTSEDKSRDASLSQAGTPVKAGTPEKADTLEKTGAPVKTLVFVPDDEQDTKTVP